MAELGPDERLERAFAVFAPSTEATVRIARALEPAFDAPLKSLAAEWLELLRIRPFVHGVLTAATATGLGVLTPLGTIITALVHAAQAGR